MRRQHPLALSVVSAWLLWGAVAQAQVVGRPLDPCPAAGEVRPSDLYGLWHFSLWSTDGNEAAVRSRGAMLLEAHPEYPGGVRGRLQRSTQGEEAKAHVSGDLTDGEFQLDESEDGIAMSAVWTGQPSPTDCRLDIRGTRRAAEGQSGGDPEWNFLLKKVPAVR